MKFNLRDLFSVTLVIALALGRWLDRRDLSFRTESAEMQTKNAEVRADTATKAQIKAREELWRLHIDTLKRSDEWTERMENLFNENARLKGLPQYKK